MSITYSLEIFPPKTLNDDYWQTLSSLANTNPNFISVTCSAGGTGSSDITAITDHFHKKCNFSKIAAHMVCLGRNENELLQLADQHQHNNINAIVALRGDSYPNDKQESDKNPADFVHAYQLVELLRKHNDKWDIAVAAYPEKHPQSPDLKTDLTHLKNKVASGANRILTQFFFDPQVFLRYRDKITAMGIDVPLIPGILPIINFTKMLDFAKRCETNVPDFLVDLLQKCPEEEDKHKVAFAFLTHQIETLQKEGIDNFHFYTLNNSPIIELLTHWISYYNNIKK